MYNWAHQISTSEYNSECEQIYMKINHTMMMRNTAMKNSNPEIKWKVINSEHLVWITIDVKLINIITMIVYDTQCCTVKLKLKTLLILNK